MKNLRVCALVLPLLFLAAPAGAAGKPAPAAPHPVPKEIHLRHLGGAGEWQAYAFREKSGPVCYLVGSPIKTEPKALKRKRPVAMVTHRPDEHVFNVVSFTEFYPLKSGSDVSLDVGGTDFDLFSHGDTAWSRSSDTDKTIVEGMAKGREAIVKATPRKGPQTADTYSLIGFTKALSLIDKACGVER